MLSHSAVNTKSLGNIALIKKVGNTKIKAVHRSFCHCGAVELALELPNGIEEPCVCNCSICRKKGYVQGAVPLSALKIIKGEDKLRVYQFNTKVAEHYFCTVCGVHTHQRRRSNPNLYSINIACLEGVDPYLIKDVIKHDGANNHPSDK